MSDEQPERATVEFEGEEFLVSERVGMMALMKFAKMAQAGVDSMSMLGLATMYDLLEQCIAPEDWDRFCAHADETRADGEQLMMTVGKTIAVLAGRPTTRPSDSSDGSLSTNESSVDDSALRVIADLEEQGRPDLALHVLRAQEGLRASA